MRWNSIYTRSDSASLHPDYPGARPSGRVFCGPPPVEDSQKRILEEIEKDRKALRRLMWSSETAETLLSIYRAVNGMSGLESADWRHSWSAQDWYHEHVRQTLGAQIWLGKLRIYEVRDEGVGLPQGADPFSKRDDPLSPAPPPASLQSPKTTWFEVLVIDEAGMPVPGLDLTFSVGADAVTTDGAGVARIKAQGSPASSTVRIVSPEQAMQILQPRWTAVREPEIPAGRDVSVFQLTDSPPSATLRNKRRHTIVLTPEHTWIEVRVVNDNNEPIQDKRARLHLTNGRVVERMLGNDGRVRSNEIPAGVCKFVLPVEDRAEWIDPDAPAPAEDPKELPEGHWIVRKHIKPPGPEVPDLRTGEQHTIVVGRKIAEQLEIDDALFRLMSAVLLPEAQNPDAAPTEPDGTRPTAMDLLAASLRYAELHPDRKILVTGHTDTSGGDEYNQDLSESRAATVYAVLANDSGSREDFGDQCHGPHLQGKEKKQQVLYDDRVQVLNWVAATFGWPCSTNGEFSDYLRAVEDFQSTYNTEGNAGYPIEQLDVDGDFGPATWRGVFDCYQVHLAKTLECTTEELQALQGQVRPRFLKQYVGCGENKPKEMAGVDNFRSQTNRRVEVLFFEPPDHVPETPCLAGECDPDGCELYDRRWYLRRRLPTRLLARCNCTLDRLQFLLNGSWRDVPEKFTDIGKDTSISFKAIYSGSECSPDKIKWSGDASGTGEKKQVKFTSSGSRIVNVSCCGSEKKILVEVDLPNSKTVVIWDPAGYTGNNVDDASTCVERNFTVTYTASADIDNNKWMLRIDEIHGGADITVNYGGSRNPITSPPTNATDAQQAVTVMKGYFSRGSRGRWHTETASRSHEEYHYREWKETGNHYWPATETAIEKIETSYHDHATETAAIAAMKIGADGATNKIAAFKQICRQYWFTLGDGAGDRPYAAGQLALNPAIQSVQILAAVNGWTVPAGVDTPSTATPCYQPWLPYNP